MKEKAALTGKWRLVELPDLSEDYLGLTPDPHVQLKVSKDGSVEGTYQFGAQSGQLDDWWETSKEGQIKITFMFEGEDELDPVHGFGTAILIAPDTLKGKMHYYKSDTYRLILKRI